MGNRTDNIHAKYSGSNLTVAQKADSLAVEWFKQLPPTAHFTDKNKVVNDCFNYIVENYKPSGFVVESWVFWLLLRMILWWVAQNFVNSLYEEKVTEK
jgi:hypothetical protein